MTPLASASCAYAKYLPEGQARPAGQKESQCCGLCWEMFQFAMYLLAIYSQ